MTADLKAILFDVDDTLFDRHGAQLMALAAVVRQFPGVFAGIDHGIAVEAFLESDRIIVQEFSESDYAFGQARSRRQQLFLRLLGLDESPAEEMAKFYVEVYPRSHAPIEGAEAVVQELAACFRLGIVSNGFPDVQYQKLETLEIHRFFECIVLSEELGIRKADPGIFWRATELLGVRPDDCLYVGDSYANDVVGGKQAGMCVCWFNPGGQAAPGDVLPDLEVRALREVVEVVL
jgi:HAD superfamily hydrolase (TIGR01549 family)